MTDSPKPTNSKPSVVLVPDEPASGDEFDAGAHRSVARAIADLILSEPGGRVIGLEGSWGSGKSTVVGLVCDYLKPSTGTKEETHAVIIDAWAHQGDPLRRTFLESIIDGLQKKGWLDERVGRQFKESLTGRASSVRTKTSAHLSVEGTTAAVAALFIPLGAALLVNTFKTHHAIAQQAGALLLAGPLFVVTAFALAKLLGMILGGRNDAVRDWRRRLSSLNPVGFFAKEQSTDTTTEGIERGEPTSVEFELMFGQILKASIDDRRRLLLILDNIDRVDAEDARNILATMQTFTSSSNRTRTGLSPRVWTLIPYDLAGLDRLWASGNRVDEAETPTAAAFIEKLFQVRFETPPLVLSDWRGYLHRLLRQAFPSADDNELEAILRLRALYPGVEANRVVSREDPTPRQLKQFVNQIGVIRRQRDDIAIAHTAYYVLLRRDRFNVPEKLIDGSVPHPNLGHLFSASVRDDLAAMHFGTTQELAQQLLLGGALEGALAKADETAIDRLKDRQGFIDALDSLDLKSRTLDGGVELTRAVAVLEAAGALSMPALSSWSKNVLQPVAKECSSWILAGRESGIGLAILADLCSSTDPELTDFLTRIEQNARSGDEKGQQQVEGLAGLADALLQRNRALEATPVRIDLPAERLVSSLAQFKSAAKNQKSHAAIELSTTSIEVAKLLVQAAVSDGEKSVMPALDVLTARPERIDLATLANESAQWLRTQDPKSAEQLEALLRIIDLTRRMLSVEIALTPIANDGTLMNIVWVGNNNSWHSQIATASLLHLVAQPSFPDPQPLRESVNGAQLIRQGLGNPEAAPKVTAAQTAWLIANSDEAASLLLTIKATDAFRPWVNHQLKELMKADALVVSPADFLSAWQYLKAVLGPDEFAKLAGGLLKTPDDRQLIFDGGSSDTALTQELLADADDDSRGSVAAWASEQVRSATTTEWESALGSPEGGPILDIALKLVDGPATPADPSGLSGALHSHFKSLARSEAVWQPDDDTFMKLAGLLPSESRHVLASQLCAELEGFDGAVGPALFTAYGKFLASEKTFRTHQKLPNFVDRLIAHDDWISVQWIVATGEGHPDTFDPKGRKDEMQHLTMQVREKLKDLGDDAPDVLKRLAELMPAVK